MYSCVVACQLLIPAAAALVRAPYPKAAKVSKEKRLSTFELLLSSLEIC